MYTLSFFSGIHSITCTFKVKGIPNITLKVRDSTCFSLNFPEISALLSNSFVVVFFFLVFFSLLVLDSTSGDDF